MRKFNIHKWAIGEWKFISEAIIRWFNIAIPVMPCWYDFLIEKDGIIKRIQVKSVSQIDKSSGWEKIKCMLTHGSVKGKRWYTSEQVDIIALYSIQLDIWYIFPIAEVEWKLTISLFPTVENSRSKYEIFRNNWNSI